MFLQRFSMSSVDEHGRLNPQLEHLSVYQFSVAESKSFFPFLFWKAFWKKLSQMSQFFLVIVLYFYRSTSTKSTCCSKTRWNDSRCICQRVKIFWEGVVAKITFWKLKKESTTLYSTLLFYFESMPHDDSIEGSHDCWGHIYLTRRG